MSDISVIGAAIVFGFIMIIILAVLANRKIAQESEKLDILESNPLAKARQLRASDPERSFYWFNKALEAGNPQAHLEIYKLSESNNNFIPRDLAWTHLEKAARHGSAEANLILGLHSSAAGNFEEAEQFLSTAAKAGSIPATEELERLDAKRLRQQAKAGSGEKQRSSADKPKETAHPDPEKHFAQILGLKGPCSKNDVKEAYRNLAAQYHPDKAAHLGPKLRAQAEEEMKRINEAFAYFKRKYDI